MTAPLVDRLRALALHQDLAECAEAADRIETLSRFVVREHGEDICRPLSAAAIDKRDRMWLALCICSDIALGYFETEDEAVAAHAAHVAAILDGSAS